MATADEDLAQRLSQEIAALGWMACIARSSAGCLRMATAIGPDLVLLDARLPRQLEVMLRSHPATATTGFVRVEAATALGSVWEEASAA